MNRTMPAAETPPPASFALFTGSDIVSREAARERLLAAVHQTHGSATLFSFDPSIESMDAFLARFITVSMFPEPRVFQVRHAELCNDAELAAISANLDHKIPDAYLVIESESAGGTGKAAKMTALVKAFQSRAKKHPGRYAIENFPCPREYEIPAWIVQNTPRLYNRSITQKNAELLADLVGPDLGAIHSELQKLDLHLDSGKSIERRDIDLICGASREMAPYELAQCLGKRDLARALEIVDRLFQSSFYAPPIIAAIFRHFWSLWRIRAFAAQHPDDMNRFLNAQKRSDRQTQNALGVRIGIAAGIFTEQQAARVYPALIKPDMVGQARTFKDEHLKRIFAWLEEFDIGVKTGKIEADKISVQLLCYKIARIEEIEGG